ncbi:single-stranded DNA-binding protein [Candidatus Falkowbacteria bacterium]|nr:single-stranded DNA-binding protein [Candidatus Falkowbacteria bacterium]
MNLNKAMIIGNITRDPEVRNTPGGQMVATFSIATNQVWNDQSGQKQERVEYHNIVVWRRLAEICSQYLRKGSKVYVEGRLQTREWSGQDGVKRYRTEIIGENLIMLDRAGNSGGNSQPINNGFSAGGYEQPTAPNEPIINIASGADEEEIKVENIPF